MSMKYYHDRKHSTFPYLVVKSKQAQIDFVAKGIVSWEWKMSDRIIQQGSQRHMWLWEVCGLSSSIVTKQNYFIDLYFLHISYLINI